MPILSALPPIPAIPIWVAGVRQEAATHPPRARLEILERAGVTLLTQAALMAASPNWAESYVEGAGGEPEFALLE